MEDKVDQLRRLKARRSREREIRDLEEKMLLDSLTDTDRKLRGTSPVARARGRLHLSKNKDIRNIQIQYERDRAKNQYAIPRKDYSKLPRYQPQADPKVKQLAETHGRQMQYLHDRNIDLERQREEIRRRLEELGKRPVVEDDSTNALLQELRDQEARNRRLLEELRRQLMEGRQIPVPVTDKKQPYIYPVYYGNSLVAEIVAMRQAYIQNGGNNPDILQQLAQMQAEAQAIDDSLRNRPAPAQAKTKRDPDAIHALELENERLQRQLLLLQEQNLMAKQRRKDDREGRDKVKAKAIHYSPPRRRAQTFISDQVPPLDTRGILPRKERVLRRYWTSPFDPLKWKIDRDVGNMYGYKFRKRPEEEEEEKPLPRTDTVDTLCPEASQNQVHTMPIRPRKDPELALNLEPLVDNEDTSTELPYYKNHLVSARLNEMEKSLRENYAQTSMPNLKEEELELMDRFHEEDKHLNLASMDSGVRQIHDEERSGPAKGRPKNPQLILETEDTVKLTKKS